jgi:glutathione S-transferase
VGIEVFWFSGSPFAWRVLLTLEIKGQPYQSRLIQRSDGDHRKPEFLAMNPRGRVPVLRDGDTVIHESIAIMAYLDRRFPAPPLFGRDAAEAAQVWQWVIEETTEFDQPADEYILALYFGRMAERASAVRAALPKIEEYLARAEETLRSHSWLVGEAPSAADIALFPMVKSLERAGAKPGAADFELRVAPLEKGFPAIARWVARIAQLPGYERTTPPHWR